MKIKIGLLGLILPLLFISCNDQSISQSTIPMTADDLNSSTKLDDMSNDVLKFIENQFSQQYGLTGKSANVVESILPSCATLTTVKTATTWTRTIDFGTTGCALPNGNVLSGKIIMSGNIHLNIPRYTINYSLKDFHHNNILVHGSRTIIRKMVSNSNQQTLHPVHMTDLSFTATDSVGLVRSISGMRIREMVQGFDTAALDDDAFLISGHQKINTSKGTILTTITTPLSIVPSCSHIASGVVVHSKNNETATLDYGNGTCDNFATITVNGMTKTIQLRK